MNHIIENFKPEGGWHCITTAYKQVFHYYGYDISDVKDLLQEVKEPTSKVFIPEDILPSFDCSLMQEINKWVQKHGNNMLFIYGEYDTWSASAVELTGETNAVKMVKKGGSHRTRINSFNQKEREIIYSTLENWLDIEIKRIGNTILFSKVSPEIKD